MFFFEILVKFFVFREYDQKYLYDLFESNSLLERFYDGAISYRFVAFKISPALFILNDCTLMDKVDLLKNEF